MNAISFHIVGVINAADLNEAARILDPARRRFEEDGRILVLQSHSALHRLTDRDASATAAECLSRALDMALGDSARGWFSRLLAEAGADDQQDAAV